MQRVKSVSSMPFVNGFGITLVQDHRGAWRFGGLYRGLDTVSIPISPDDQQRGFENPEAVTDYFRQQYRHKLPVE